MSVDEGSVLVALINGVKINESRSKVARSSGSQQKAITPTNDNTNVKVMEERSYRVSPEPEEWHF